MTDMVNHPAHYTSDPSGVECIEIVRHRNYNIGNAIKYLWRAGLKNQDKHLEDLKKAIFYINDEIKRIEMYSGIAKIEDGEPVITEKIVSEIELAKPVIKIGDTYNRKLPGSLYGRSSD